MDAIISNLKLKPQECAGNYKFTGKLYMTQGFIHEFGDNAYAIALTAHRKVILERVNSEAGADYLQIFEFNGIRFWMIDDVEHITILLPEEY